MAYYYDALVLGFRVAARRLLLVRTSALGDVLLVAPVADAVWDLFVRFVQLHGPRPTIVEWDEAVPPLGRVLEECERARELEAVANLRAVGT